MTKIKLEVQYFKGCPNGPAMLETARKVLAEMPEGLIEYKETPVEDDSEAKKLGFRGSPTLLINSEDFANMPVPEDPVMSCRFYPDGMPQVEEIKSRINKLTDL